MAGMIGDLEELTALIHRAARQEALDVEAGARQTANQTRDTAAAEAQALHAQTLAAARATSARERQRLLAQVALETQRQLLAAREQILDSVWAQAELALRATPSEPDYDQTLRRLALAAARSLGQGDIVLAADAAGHALLTPDRLTAWSAEAHVTFVRADEAAPIWGGLLARTADSRRQVDGSFPTLLALASSQLRERIATQLGIT